jgi:hypothetical protein
MRTARNEPKLSRAVLQAAFISRNSVSKASSSEQVLGPDRARRRLGDQNLDIPKDATMSAGWSETNLFYEK